MSLPSSRKKLACSGLMLSFVLPACGKSVVEQQTEALTLSSEIAAWREVSSRRFDTSDEVSVQTACVGVLQDLGFALEESSTELNLLIAHKDRDATEVLQTFWAILYAAIGGDAAAVSHKDQTIRISIVTKVVDDSTVVRVTVQRLIRNMHDQVIKAQTIEDPEIYQQFFDKLAQAIFLEGHES